MAAKDAGFDPDWSCKGVLEGARRATEDTPLHVVPVILGWVVARPSDWGGLVAS